MGSWQTKLSRMPKSTKNPRKICSRNWQLWLRTNWNQVNRNFIRYIDLKSPMISSTFCYWNWKTKRFLCWLLWEMIKKGLFWGRWRSPAGPRAPQAPGGVPIMSGAFSWLSGKKILSKLVEIWGIESHLKFALFFPSTGMMIERERERALPPSSFWFLSHTLANFRAIELGRVPFERACRAEHFEPKFGPKRPKIGVQNGQKPKVASTVLPSVLATTIFLA